MIKVWLAQHGLVFIQTLSRLASMPLTSLLSILIIGVAFSLPVGIYIFLENLQVISGQTVVKPQMSLFLKQGAVQQDFDNLRQRLVLREEVEQFQFVSKEQALLQLQQSAGLGDIIRSLKSNPLPDTFIVDVKDIYTDAFEQLQTDMQSWPEVEYVQFDSVWSKRLNAILNFGHVIVTVLFVLLSTGVITVMFNTIRLQILTKRDEIELSQLIGATNSFIQRPFLYFGTLQGLAGGFIAWLITALALHVMNNEFEVLADLYAMELRLKHLSVGDSVSLLLFSACLGWLGARLSVANHLWQFQSKD